MTEPRSNADEAGLEVQPHKFCVDGWNKVTLNVPNPLFSFCPICCVHEFVTRDIQPQCVRCGMYKNTADMMRLRADG